MLTKREALAVSKKFALSLILLLIAFTGNAGDKRLIVKVTAECSGDSLQFGCDRLTDLFQISLLREPRIAIPKSIRQVEDYGVFITFTSHASTVYTTCYVRHHEISATVEGETGPQNTLYEIINKLSAKVISKIKDLESNLPTKKILLIALENENAIGKEKYEALLRRLSYKLFSSEFDNDRVIFKSVRQTDFSSKTVEGIVQAGAYDGLLTLGLSVSRDEPFLVSKLYIHSLDKVVKLPTLPYDQSVNFLRDYASTLSNYVVDEAGQWRADRIAGITAELGNKEQIMSRATTAYNSGDLTAASLLTLSELEVHPKSTEAAALLGKIRFKQKRYEESLLFASDCLENEPNSLECLCVSGLDYVNMDDLGAARPLLRKAFGKDPTAKFEGTDIALSLGKTLLQLDSVDHAIKVLANYNQTTGSEDSKYWLGKAYVRKRNFEQTISLLSDVGAEKYSDVAQLLASAYFSRGENYFNNKKYSEALGSYKAAGERSKTLSVTFQMMKCYNRLGQLDKADSIIQASREGIAQAYLAQGLDLRHLFDETRNKNPDLNLARKAIENLGKYLATNPTDARMMWWTGNTYVDLGDYPGSISYLEKAFTLDTTAIAYRLDLAEASILSNNTNRVRQLVTPYQLNSWRGKGLTRNLTLLLFLRTIANTIDNIDEPQTSDELSDLLRKDNLVYSWDLGAFKSWLAQSSFATNEKIQSLTTKLERQTKITLKKATYNTK